MISVVIPHFNQNEYLNEAIESALNQTVPVEVIVVDDCSTTKPTVPDNVKLILNNENKGLSSARNTGIKASTGDYLVCLDSDDKLPPDYLEKLSSVDADIVGCGYRTFGDYEKEWKSRGDITLDDLLDGNRTQCSALFKRTVFDKVQFDEQMKHGQEDHAFWLEAVARGFTMKCTDQTHLLYRKHGESMVSHNPKYSKENAEHIAKKLLSIIRT
jgi:glycosyltransferase involved in cell wall biosynthesis